ncbi:MAG: ABC transporter ATP-binding protein [Pseudorhodoplanes sp.]|nr:ABC transporter ATP-binding protein [Pseudorhodoplanes sp.]
MKHAAPKDVDKLATFFAIYRTLIHQRPRLLVAVVALSFAAALSEGVGLAIIYPMLDSVVGSGKLQGGVWDWLRNIAVSISGTSPTEGLLYLAIIVFGLKAVLLAMNVVATSLWINRLQEDWRLAALSHYLYGPYREIVGERRGKIIQNILGETGTASKGVEQLLILVTKSVFAVVLIGTLFVLNWKMTAALLLVVALVVLIIRSRALGFMQRLGRKRLTSKQAMMAVTAEPIFAASTIKLLGVENDVLESLKRPQRKQTRVNVLMALFTKAPDFFVEFIVVAVVAIIFIVMARGFGVPYQDTAPLIGAFAIVCSRLLNVLSSLFNMRLNLATIAPTLPLVERLVRSDENADVVKRGETLGSIQGDIEFRNVSFSYTPDKEVLTNLSLTFPKGKMIGIVGETGVGKSTIGYLIGRLYDPRSGAIFVNGRDIRDFSIQSLRRRLGYVEQNPAIFNGTVAENIALGAPGASREDVERAAKAAELHDFILSLPNGYDTPVHDQGSTLSGGERQRLAIARAIVRKPDVFVFDEGTSALDQKTEAAVQRSIQTLAGDATVIVIAHRIATLKHADLIYELLPGGKVVTRRFEEIAA